MKMLVILMLAAALVAGTSSAACADRTPITGKKYQLVFRDEFNSLSSEWKRGFPWDSATPSDAVYADGRLHIATRRVQNYPGLNVVSTRSFRRGYFEARIKIPAGIGHHSAWWMLSENWIKTRNCSSLKVSELDILEAYGNMTRSHDGALHRNTSSGCGMVDDTRPPWPAFRTNLDFDMSYGFHVYAALWTASEVVWYVDDREIKRTPAWDTTDQPMSLILSSFVGYFGPQPDATTPDVLDVQVDYVRVWQIRTG